MLMFIPPRSRAPGPCLTTNLVSILITYITPPPPFIPPRGVGGGLAGGVHPASGVVCLDLVGVASEGEKVSTNSEAIVEVRGGTGVKDGHVDSLAFTRYS